MFGWGVADFIQGVAIRRIGTATAMMIRNVMTLGICLTLGAILYSNDQISVTISDVIIMILSSGLYVSGYLYYMRGFEFGKASVVAPIASAYAIITVLLSIVLNDEVLSTAQIAAVVIMIAGVSLVSINLRQTSGFWRQHGVKEAFLALGFFGFAFYIAGFAAQSMRGELAFLISGLSQSIIFLILSFIIGARIGLMKTFPIQLYGVFVIHAVLVNGAWVAYLFGANLGNISIVASVSSVFSGITALLGIVITHEKLVPNQYMGILMILCGVALVSL